MLPIKAINTQTNVLLPSSVNSLLGDTEEMVFRVDLGPICTFPLSSLCRLQHIMIRIGFLVET